MQNVAIGEDPMAIQMNTAEIWVQVHQLPFGIIDTTMGALVGSHIGGMTKYDEDNNYGPWRKYIKIRVEIVIEGPLKQDIILER